MSCLCFACLEGMTTCAHYRPRSGQPAESRDCMIGKVPLVLNPGNAIHPALRTDILISGTHSVSISGHSVFPDAKIGIHHMQLLFFKQRSKSEMYLFQKIKNRYFQELVHGI